MIASLLPRPQVAVATATAADYDAPLASDEAQGVSHAVVKRRREFAAGRACAHRALSRLGRSVDAIPVGSRREPVWPSGIVGSITHCDGYCAAAVASQRHMMALGIDAEQRRPVGTATQRLFCTPAELAAPPVLDDARLPVLIFSAKEAVFKAWSALSSDWLDYLDAEIDFQLAAGRFSVRLVDGHPLPGVFRGRFAVTDHHVFTAVTVVEGRTTALRL